MTNVTERIGQVRDHGGETPAVAREYFVRPPAELGQILSAWSTLGEGEQPLSASKRAIAGVIFAAIAALVGAGIFKLSGSIDPTWRMLWLIGPAMVGFLLGWLGSGFAHTVTYVGTDGIARFACRKTTDNITKREVLRFADAAELRTNSTMHYKNGVYTGTTWSHTWADGKGKRLLHLNGRYGKRAHELPPSTDLYHFARAAEVSWSDFILQQLEDALGRNGFVEFPITGRDYVRIGKGWLELSVHGKNDRREAADIASVQLVKGVFAVEMVDAKKGFFTNSGVFRFDYASMANARVFMLALQRLCGLTIT